MKKTFYAILLFVVTITNSLGIYSDSSAQAVLTGQATVDNFGHSVSGAGDFNGDGKKDFIVGAYLAAESRGRVYIYFGGASYDTIPDLTITGLSNSENFGLSVASADVNNDGKDDLIIGAPAYSSGRGRAYIFFGGTTPDTIPDVILTGINISSRFGFSVSSAGDMNNDNFKDVLIGAPGLATVFNDGKAFLYLGGASMDNIADVTYNPPTPQVGFGHSVSTAGFLDNDDYSDIIIGSPDENSGAGKAYIFLGSDSVISFIYLTLTGNGGFFGNSVSSAGDVNNDTYDDVMVGAPGYNSSTGIVRIYYGGNPMNNTADDSLSGQGFSFFGSSLSAGDIDNNGYSDLLIGAYGRNALTGEAFLVYNFPGGVKKIKQYSGETQQSNFGTSVSITGDLNQDGRSDFIIGAPGYSLSKGRAYVYNGSVPTIDLIVYAWIQGFYDPNSNNQVSDTITVELRNSVSPFALAESKKTILNSGGNGLVNYFNAVAGNYYVVIKHRNGLETWKSQPVQMDNYNSYYNISFSAAASDAYGNNEIQIDSSPLRFGIYSGDVNQDGHINLQDNILVNNDESNFVTGYVPTDVNGDNIVGLADALIAYDNSTNFVEVIKP